MLAGHAHRAWQPLQRLRRQFGTAVTAACSLEGQGWLLLGQLEAHEAVSHFEQALARWQQLGRPPDQVQALNGLSRARKRAGEDHAARATAQLAMTLATSLADQLEDAALKASYRETATVPPPPPDPCR